MECNFTICCAIVKNIKFESIRDSSTRVRAIPSPFIAEYGLSNFVFHLSNTIITLNAR